MYTCVLGVSVIQIIQISNDSSHGRMQRKGNTCTISLSSNNLLIKKVNASVREHLTLRAMESFFLLIINSSDSYFYSLRTVYVVIKSTVECLRK